MNQSNEASPPQDPLWLIDEIHIRAVQDSKDDGIGDLCELNDRLDYGSAFLAGSVATARVSRWVVPS